MFLNSTFFQKLVILIICQTLVSHIHFSIAMKSSFTMPSKQPTQHLYYPWLTIRIHLTEVSIHFTIAAGGITLVYFLDSLFIKTWVV
ncbi:hypothetical protein EB796_019312 [Bugula neritina]|uniref:Uncharacterized protein n=1 Tax=Bugula neritina TaxID=10212 RepID=A0A7J7J842_BUGNE|nr:hypothetical protein EB796_019312 [Bugula neritina]